MSGLLAIDWGSKRVGLAMADTNLPVPRALPSLQNSGDLFERLRGLIEELSIAQIIVGRPLSLEGQETAQTKQITDFAQQLHKDLKLPVVMQDETLTSAAAGARFGNKAHDRDSESAVIILQDYLEGAARPR